MFVEEEWEWDSDRDRAFVFLTYEQADAKARSLGGGAYPAIRAAADDSRLPIADSKDAAPTPEPARAAAVHGVSPSRMAAGTVKERIAAAKQNKRVAAVRKQRTAADWQRVYEATCARMGEHDDE